MCLYVCTTVKDGAVMGTFNCTIPTAAPELLFLLRVYFVQKGINFMGSISTTEPSSPDMSQNMDEAITGAEGFSSRRKIFCFKFAAAFSVNTSSS